MSLCLCLVVGLPAVSALTAQPAKRRVALVIGNGAYLRLPRLANPSNDARDLGQTLRAWVSP